MRFTDHSIKGLKRQQSRYEVYEDGRKGLGIRISPTGTKTFFFTYRRQGKHSRVTIGQYPDVTLEGAHEELVRLRKLLRKGTDPAAARQAKKIETLKAPTVKELAGFYIERHAKVKKRSWREDERILDYDVIPRWGHLKAADIARRDVIALLDDIADRGAGTMANRTLAVVRRMYNFALERDILEQSPCVAVKGPGQEGERDRVLTDDEIRTLWQKLDETPRIHQAIKLILKLILATAQRKGEITRAEKVEFDLDGGWWTIPSTRTKNKLAHRVPLSPLALKLLDEAWTLSGDSLYVFPSPRTSNAIGELSVNHAIYKNRKAFGIEEWTPHDLRRTAASQITGMGISRLVLAKILNHKEASVTAVYDRHSYDAEKRQALDVWARKLNLIITGAPTDG